MLYRPGNEQAAVAEDYVGDYQHRHPDRQIELLDADSRAGSQMAQLYGLVRYPALLVLRQDGAVLQVWQYEHLPLMDELDFYMLGS